MVTAADAFYFEAVAHKSLINYVHVRLQMTGRTNRQSSKNIELLRAENIFVELQVDFELDAWNLVACQEVSKNYSLL